MTAYVTIPNTDVDAESPIDVDLMTALRDNPISIAEQDPTAPRQVGANLVEIASATAGPSATIDFTTGIDSTYAAHLFTFVGMHPATDTVALQMRVSTDGGSIWETTGYYFHLQIVDSAAATYSAVNGASVSIIQLSSGQGNATSEDLDGNLMVYGLGDSSLVTRVTGNFVHQNASAAVRGGPLIGSWQSTSAVNAVRFLFSSGNIDLGTIRLYGVKNV